MKKFKYFNPCANIHLTLSNHLFNIACHLGCHLAFHLALTYHQV
jgi:hypothetical protein